MKKIMMLIILIITVTNCSLFDMKELGRSSEREKRKGS